MEKGKQSFGNIFLTICILLFLGGFAVCNFGLAKGVGEKLVQKKMDFSTFVQEIQSVYTSDDLALKEEFINLNGLFARIIGRRNYNSVVLMNNGMLGQKYNDYSTKSITKTVTEFASFLDQEDINIPFVYVQAPYKEDLTGELFPEGLESCANVIMDEMLDTLETKGVRTLDMRPFTVETPEMVEQYFFRTDHHWNYDGAFVAFQQIAYLIDEMFPEKEVNITYTEKEQWQSYTLEDWFLGSRGKRVGVFYGGVDDITYYLPKFETNMSLSNGKHMELYKGTFEDAIVRPEYIQNKDYFHDNAYCIYIGGSYPVVKIQNQDAPNDLKVVVVGDSFSRPVYSFLSTVVSEINVVDPRYMTECTVAEYVEAAEPDLVLMLINPTMYTAKKFFKLGVEEFLAKKEQSSEEIIAVENKQIKLKKNDKNNNIRTMPVEQGKTYTLTFDDVVFHDKTSEGVVVSLYNKTKKRRICSTVFDVEYCRENKEFRWVFCTPDLNNEDELVLQFFAGMFDETKDIGVTYEGINLSY